MGKVQNVTQLFLLCHLQCVLYTIIHKPIHVISHRHLTEGTGASEAGLIPKSRLFLVYWRMDAGRGYVKGICLRRVVHTPY